MSDAQRTERIARELSAAIEARDFARLAELLDDDLSYEVCGIEMAGAGVFDKQTLLANMPAVLSLFEDEARA